ncbi:MAG: hypothetical protein BWY77_01741 [bacterium ADurb.Bin431]|nr:MAG: hypothetical protein BWY77_01741 [bacterium ADurb.Bin431]
MARNSLELFAFGVVDEADEGFVGRFVIEEIVLIDFVGSDHHLKIAGQVHPGHVALVVIVRSQPLRAQPQEIHQGGIIAEIRCGLEVFGRLFHQGLPVGVEGHRRQAPSLAPDHSEGPLKGRLVLGMGNDPGLELVPGQIVGIETGPGRLGLSGQPGRVVVEAVPGAEHEAEHLQIGGILGGFVAFELFKKGGIVGMNLAQEELVHHFSRADDLAQGHPVRRGEGCEIAVESNRCEFIQFGLDGRCGRPGWKVGLRAAAGEGKGKDHKDSD